MGMMDTDGCQFLMQQVRFLSRVNVQIYIEILLSVCLSIRRMQLSYLNTADHKSIFYNLVATVF